ncbi:MAG: DUF1385 domain-containing protein [Candidatus Marinimicrobia bacterium]|nr:DUF1385 domain-containing protein [Candidatus Neomarinimicrobiota bacterium]
MKYIFRVFKSYLSIILQKASILVGGQAVIEGVMMRVPGAYATAVRTPDGEIAVERKEFVSLAKRNKFFAFPIIRGVVALFESMKIGMKTLTFSAEKAYPEENENKDSFWNKVLEYVSIVFAFGLAIGLFLVLPLFLTTKIFTIEKTAWAFNAVAGVFRIVFFLAYLMIISLMKDVKRLFEYHGAEHKTVFAFENGEDMSIESTHKYPTFHPRCGTSFLFITLIFTIIIYATIDSILIYFTGPLTLANRLLIHLPMIPLVMGIGYEGLKFTSKQIENKWLSWMVKPGLWLQRITTSPPDDKQIECAITALKEGFGDKWEEYVGSKYVAEAIE